MTASVRRVSDQSIIFAGMDDRMGGNINGPSLIRCPDWVENPLATYYLYFASHRGTYIRLAYADDVHGPWQVHSAGALDLSVSGFPQENELDKEGSLADQPYIYAHIASPDVHVLKDRCEIRMYYHGLCRDGSQASHVATSTDGLTFRVQGGTVAPAYLRAFPHADSWFGIAMPGVVMKSPDGLKPFEIINDVLPRNARHCAVAVEGDILRIVWSQVSEAPERLYVGLIDLTTSPEDWVVSNPVELLRPEKEWEGAHQPLAPSVYGAADAVLNELRDPCLFADDDISYLLYAGGGESGIGVAFFKKSSSGLEF